MKKQLYKITYSAENNIYTAYQMKTHLQKTIKELENKGYKILKIESN